MTPKKYKALTDKIVEVNPDISEIDEEGNEIRRDITLEDVLASIDTIAERYCSFKMWTLKKPLHKQDEMTQKWLYSVIVEK